MLAKAYLTALAGYLSLVASLPTEILSNIIEGRDNSHKYLSLDFQVTRSNFTNGTAPAKTSKRSDDVGAPISNQVYHYNIDLLFGSNQQPITVSVDTGSSDLWVPDSNAQCSNCNGQGSYNPSQSSHSKNTGQSFQLSYIDGSTTSGTYYLDDVTIPGGPTVKQFQFADATTTSINAGILGIGLNSTEALVFSDHSGPEYADFPWALKNQGYIDKAAYSLYLNSPSATSGTLLLGGIDNAKVANGLLKLPGAFPSRLGAKTDSVIIDGNSHNIGTGFCFDSGYSYSTFPQPIADAIGGALNGAINTGGNNPWSISCNQPDKYFTFSFGNGQKAIQVPYSSFIAPGSENWYGQCTATISYSSDGSDYNNLPTFGDDVLRSFYVVYDLEENTVSVGQAKYTSDSDISPIQ